MPPPPKATSSKVARPVARYRPGKAPVGAGGIDEYSDSDEERDAQHDDDADQKASESARILDLSSGTAALAGSHRRTAGIVINDGAGPSSGKKLDLRLQPASAQQEEAEEGSSEYETDTDDEAAAPAKPIFRKPGAPASQSQPQPQVNASGSSSEYETDSSEEDSEDTAPAPLLKPIFVPKRARTTIPTNDASNGNVEDLDAEAKAEAAASARRKEAHDLAALTIQRSLAEQKHAETHTADVDDTDGLDPEAEFEAWRTRELARLARDRDELLAKRKEQDEINAFKALPEKEKERLGKERAAQQRAEKMELRKAASGSEGGGGFMQKYYHKGSFFQDMDILKRDYTEKTEKEVDRSKLPKMMQVRGYGEKGRSKWTHLANEDTSKGAMKLAAQGRGGRGEGGCFVCGGEHLKKDCPERNGEGRGEGGSGSGANRAELAQGGGGEGGRKWGQERRSQDQLSERERDRRRDRSCSPRRESSRSHRDDDGESKSRHHSRSDDRPHRSRDDRDRDHRDKHASSSRSHRDDHDSRRRRDDEDRDQHRSHRHERDHKNSHRDDDRQRSSHSRSDRHDPDDRKYSRRHHHDVDEEGRERHKRRESDRDDHREHHSSSSSARHRGAESDRKRSRLDA